jgi:ATP-dependent protease HslVU (ClpYQ) peptidase subunit
MPLSFPRSHVKAGKKQLFLRVSIKNMTWVLAKPFMQDYSLVIADICVTFTDLKTKTESYADCLLKIHDISRENGLMVGFSGHVENAFSIIDDMRMLANGMALKSQNRKFDVLDFIKEWREYTTKTGRHQHDDFENSVAMFVAGNHTENNSSGNKYAPCAVYKIESPNYRPMSTGPHQWSHIGSGSDMIVCKEIVDQLSNDIRFRIAAIDARVQDLVDFLAPKLSAVLEQQLNENGVSSKLVIGISTIGDTALAATYRIGGSSSNPFSHLAKTYEELQGMFKDTLANANFFAPR